MIPKQDPSSGYILDDAQPNNISSFTVPPGCVKFNCVTHQLEYWGLSPLNSRTDAHRRNACRSIFRAHLLSISFPYIAQSNSENKKVNDVSPAQFKNKFKSDQWCVLTAWIPIIGLTRNFMKPPIEKTKQYSLWNEYDVAGKKDLPKKIISIWKCVCQSMFGFVTIRNGVVNDNWQQFDSKSIKPPVRLQYFELKISWTDLIYCETLFQYGDEHSSASTKTYWGFAQYQRNNKLESRLPR